MLQLDLIEKRLKNIIPVTKQPHSTLFEAARYSLLLPGKRIRPLLTLAVLSDFGYPIDSGIDPACAIEMVHTYSLIHDDLPCMDNDSMRRGKPALHTVYGEAQAILAGDYLLTYAFEVLSSAKSLSCEKRSHLIHLLALRSGGHGMIGGQVIDILQEEKGIDPKTLDLMFVKKTAMMIMVALEFGGVIASVSEKDQKHLKEAGRLLGVGYQYTDDLFDADSEKKSPNPSKHPALTLYPRSTVRDKARICCLKGMAELKKICCPTPTTFNLFKTCMDRLN